jgi:hypothetical protein
MKNPVESLLEYDHASLDQLLTELVGELATPDLPRSFELLDLFWARLAVHIRAEHLHLFPALANATSQFSGKGGLPTSQQADETLALLRSDHDFFMKELADMMKKARAILAGQGVKEFEDFRQRLTVIRNRLETHNLLEEKQVYKWPSLLFDEKTVDELNERLQHELENLPPRLA